MTRSSKDMENLERNQSSAPSSMSPYNLPPYQHQELEQEEQQSMTRPRQSFDSLNQPINREQEQEIDLGTLFQGIRRRLPWIGLTTLLAGVGIYLWSSSQAPQYQASSSLVSSGQNTANDTQNNLVRATPLPEGALQEALQGPVVLGKIISTIETDKSLPAEARTKVAAQLKRELQSGKLSTIKLQSRLQQYGNGAGIYTISSTGPSPQMVVRLTDVVVDSLLAWDQGRALSGVRRAKQGLTAQLAEIDRQLEVPDISKLDRETLITARANTQKNLAQASIQEFGIAGSLEKVAPAVLPLNPIAPKPARNAILAALLTLLSGMSIAALRTVLDRTIRQEDDLLEFGLPVLGTLPQLSKRAIDLNGMIRAASKEGLYEALGFLRVNLISAIGDRPRQVLMVSSTQPGRG